MKKTAGKPLLIYITVFLFLFLWHPFSAGAAFLLSDAEIAKVNGGLVHPFSEEPILVYVENFSSATVPADDFYWGDVNGVPHMRNSGFIVMSMPDTEYTMSFPNLYASTTGYEDVPSQMAIPGEYDNGGATYGNTPHQTAFANQPMSPWFYDPTEVTDVALSHFPPAGKKQFADHGWGAILSWVDHTGADPIMWNGNLLVPADTAFFAAAHSTIEVASPRVCATASLVPGLPGDDTYPNIALAHDTDHQLGTLYIENLRVRIDGGITGPDSTVEKVIVVYPNF